MSNPVKRTFSICPQSTHYKSLLNCRKSLISIVCTSIFWLYSGIFAATALSETAFMGSQSSSSSFRPSKPTEPTFLPVEQAFKLEVNRTGQQTTLVWIVAPGYYLYKHKFEFSGKTGLDIQPLTEQTQFSQGIRKRDDYFGHVEVFYHQVTAEFTTPEAEQLVVKYQGCADAGLCYPIQTKTMELNL